MSDEKKNWGPKEIAENAANWSFAADLSLLKYLEIFSEGLLTRATTVDNNVNKLLNNLSKTSLSLDIARNKFLSLSNTQFIESRVYEDDETALLGASEEKHEEEEPNKNNSDEINKNEMRLAAMRGIEMVDKYFDKVEVVDSDSEEDSDLTSFVLRPKDQYIDRPLPYIIGTENWYKKLHVGLDDSSSESEHEKISEKFSDTESESDLPITNRSQTKSISESGSSKIDLSDKLDHPVANSTFNDTNKDYYPGSSEDFNSVSLPDSASQNSFAEQLAAKLGNVINRSTEEPTINTRPIQKTSHYDRYQNTFSDEPPPLDDDEEFSPKSKDQGIFSGGDGLFDDLNDDEPFWGGGVSDKQDKVPDSTQKPYSNLKSSNNTSDILVSYPKKGNDFKNELNSKINKLPERNLFDADAESDDDSLFKKPNVVQRAIGNKAKKLESLFDDDDTSDDASSLQTKEQSSDRIPATDTRRKEENSSFEDEDSLNVNSPDKKVPVGGIKVINNPNIFAGQDIKNLLKNKRQYSSESSESEVSKSEPTNLRKELQENKTNVKNVEEIMSGALQKDDKIHNLFDDDDEEDDLFKNNLFSNLSSKKITSNLFGKTSDGLFDDTDELNEEDPLDSTKTISSTIITENNKPKKVMSDNTSTRSDEVVHVDRPTSNNLPNTLDNSLFESDKANKDYFVGKTEKNIFAAEDESDSDDLFSSKYSKIISKNKVIEHILSSSEKNNAHISEEATSSKGTKEKSKKVPSLFDDDDNQDDDLFSSNFLQSNKVVHSTKKPDSKLDSKLFEEDTNEDDLFSTNDVLNYNHNSIFEDRNHMEGNNVSDSPEKRNKFIKDVSVESNASSKEDADIFQAKIDSENLTNKVVTDEGNDLITSKLEEKLSTQRSTVLDKLFEDDDYDKDLFETKRQKGLQKEVVATDIAAVEEHKDDGMHTSLDVILNQDKPSLLKEKQPNDVEPNDAVKNDSLKTDSIAYDNVDRIILDTKSSIADNLTPNLLEFPSEKSKKEDDVFVNSENILPVVKEENTERSCFSNSVPPAENTFSSTGDRVPSVNIFDPNPPPDLDDWETRSEQNVFDDDIYTFDNTENFNENRSSIFDREPPSVFNETSGIVRDQSRALDTDTSSFYPYATSSRRFSNDLFTEEQSSDSLFITKSNVLEPNIPSSIIEGPEDSLSTTDITPSGKLEDIYSESSELLRPKSVTFEAEFSNKSHEQVSVEHGTSKESAAVTESGKPKPILSKKPNIPKKPVALAHDNQKGHLNEDKPEEISSKQEISANIEKKSVENRGSPTKLKHNLDINVFALLPGAGKPSKKESPVKKHIPQPFQRSTSLDLEAHNSYDSSQRGPPPKENSHTLTQNERHVDDVEVLQSVTKNRARGPVKRRPSTKKGRDAIRNSCIDFTFVSSTSEKYEHNKENQGSSSEKQPLSNPLGSTVNQSPIVLAERIRSVNIETSEVSKGTEDVNKEADLHSSISDKTASNLFKNSVDLLQTDTAEISWKNVLIDDDDNGDIFPNSQDKPDDNAFNVLPKNSEFVDILRSTSFDDEEKNPQQSSLFDNRQESLQSSITGGDMQQDVKRDADSVTSAISRINESNIPRNNVRHETDNYPQTNILFETKTKIATTDKSRKTGNLFDDDTDDDDLFSSSKKQRSDNTRPNLKIADSHYSSNIGNVRQSTSVKSDKPDPSPDIGEDIFRKMDVKPKKTVVSKRLPFEDDTDDEDLFGQTSNSKLQVTSTASSSRRLKTSNLKKLENTILTGDDPLNALNN